VPPGFISGGRENPPSKSFGRFIDHLSTNPLGPVVGIEDSSCPAAL
jgi:hypothetical protein